MRATSAKDVSKSVLVDPSRVFAKLWVMVYARRDTKQRDKFSESLQADGRSVSFSRSRERHVNRCSFVPRAPTRVPFMDVREYRNRAPTIDQLESPGHHSSKLAARVRISLGVRE